MGQEAEAALRRNEAGLRLALEAGRMGSFEWVIETGEIRWSDNLEAIHGLARGAFDGTFESFQVLIHPDDRAGVLRNLRRCVESGADYEAEFRSAAPHGRVQWILGKGKVLHDEHGRASRMIGVCMDLTDRKRAEEALTEADRRKDEFLAMISHELRNPLWAIANASAVLDRIGSADPNAAEARGVIRRQTEQLTRLVNDLLDISGLAAGKMALQRTALDLAVVVRRCVDELAGARWMDRHRHELRLRPAPILGDGGRLQQVVTNLITNAVKYTPIGGSIVVEVEPEGGEAIFRVRDSGVGIAPEFLPRVFDLFAQSERGMERRGGGLGIGLALVKQLVDAHGGQVEVRSAGPDRGSEFVVRLPLAEAAGIPRSS
jgi:PAS domain S-box-containing protein